MQSDIRDPSEPLTAASELAEKAELHGEKAKGKLLYQESTRIILGAFNAVHSELGYGFLESVYSNAISVLLNGAGLRVEREVPYEIRFHGQHVGTYRADLVVQSRIVVEVKSSNAIAQPHVAQLLNYLRASRLTVGLLLNFGAQGEFKRVIWTR